MALVVVPLPKERESQERGFAWSLRMGYNNAGEIFAPPPPILDPPVTKLHVFSSKYIPETNRHTEHGWQHGYVIHLFITPIN